MIGCAPFPGSAPIDVTFAGVAATIPAKTFDRHVIAALSWYGGATLLSASMAGNAGQVMAQALSSGACAGLAFGFVPAGQSGSLSVTFTASPVFQFALYDVENWAGVDYTTYSSTAGPTSSFSASAIEGGALIGAVAANDAFTPDPTASATWSNLTKDCDNSFGSGGVLYLTTASRLFPAAASVTASCTHSHTGTTAQRGLLVSLK